MNTSNLFSKSLIAYCASVGRAIVVATVLLSTSAGSWAGEHGRDQDGHKERHRDNHSRQREHHRDGHRDSDSRRRDDNERHRPQQDHRQQSHYGRSDKRDHHGRHDDHGKRHHDRHKKHRWPNHSHYSVPKHHKRYEHTKHYHHDRHHGNEAAFLLGGVILGAVLSDVNYGAEHYYYDGRTVHNYRTLRAQACYQSYYDNGRQILVEVPREYCQGY